MSTALFGLPHYPNIFWLRKFIDSENVLIEGEEHFVKATYRNRCEIAGANGRQILSVPIAGGRDHHRLYKDTRIAYNENWQKKHWQAICTAYGSAPFFEYYEHRFRIFYETEFEFLFDYNLKILRQVMAILKIEKAWNVTTFYEKELNNKSDWRLGKGKDTTGYYQVFSKRNGFVANLCALDIIFNEGPASLAILADCPE